MSHKSVKKSPESLTVNLEAVVTVEREEVAEVLGELRERVGKDGVEQMDEGGGGGRVQEEDVGGRRVM